MKRILIILVLLALPAGSTFATIKKEKSDKNVSQTVQPEDSTGSAVVDSGGNPVSGGNTGGSRPSGYDNFIDKNDNGIDDRAEQKKEESKKVKVLNKNESEKATSKESRVKVLQRKESANDSLVKLKNR